MSTASQIASAPVREVKFSPNPVNFHYAADGIIYVRPARELPPYPARLTDRLDHWAAHTPDRVYLAARGASGDWRKLTYSQVRSKARSIAQALLRRHLSAERPIAILSGNDLQHALLALGAMYAGIPYAPISTAYSLISTDFGKLRYIFDLLTPGLVFAADEQAYRKALNAVLPNDAHLITGESFVEIESTDATEEVDRAHASVGPDTIAKFLFTSGSTGNPKGVINTQRMLCSNQELVRSILAFVAEEPPVLCEWLPWNHTFGGNHDFGLVLYNGGSFYIDNGNLSPKGMEATIRNLMDVRPTIYLHVPRGFETLVPYLRDRKEFREAFYSRLKLLYYAGAGLSQPVWDELERLAVETCGERIQWITGLGSTETGPSALFPGRDVGRAGQVGLPAPGCEVKLVPSAGKLELRLRGPSITPGYWRQPELTHAAFDEEGFYRIGDALRFIDPNDHARGFAFDGRIAEDFKLATGTWVSVGPLRAAFLAHAAPFAQDIVFAGPDRDDVRALIFPALDVCRTLCPELPHTATLAEVVASAGVRSKFETLLREFAAQSTGSSNRIAAAMLMWEPPSIDQHEITDKGSLNQRAILRNRGELVEELYAKPPSARLLNV
jgi:feruloyl-CoA synthase